MVRFLADADLNEGIVDGCLRREATMDFLSANEARLEGISDPAVLALAADQDRILVSHDFQTMPRHFGDFLFARIQSGRAPGATILAPWRRDRRTSVNLECLGRQRMGKSDFTNSAAVTAPRTGP